MTTTAAAAMPEYCTPTRRTPRGAKRREDRVASSAGITITNLHGIGSTTERNDVLPSHEDGSDARNVGRATRRQQTTTEARHQPSRAGFEFELEARIEQIRGRDLRSRGSTTRRGISGKARRTMFVRLARMAWAGRQSRSTLPQSRVGRAGHQRPVSSCIEN